MRRPSSLTERIVDRVRREGPLRFDALMDQALYDPELGFFAVTGGAGRAGADFLTSPEVGPLFGAVMARAVDAWWRDVGAPESFTLVEAGAGRGALARSILAASPECRAALRYVAVERSDRLRAEHATLDGVESRPELPTEPFVGVVLANELVDNLAVRLLEREAHGWAEVFVDADREGVLVEVLRDAEPAVAELARQLAPGAVVGSRIPIEEQAATWLARALALVDVGRVVVIDYVDDTAGLAARPMAEWLRTYRAHARGVTMLADVGVQDITVEVAVDQLAGVRAPSSNRSQAEFLDAHGLAGLVEEGRRVWRERAHLGDLEAMTARSRVSEAEALTDGRGLGRFRVLEWRRG